MQFKFGNADESPGLLFWQVSTMWRRRINNALSELNITHTQYVILAVVCYLEQSGKMATQKELSDFSMIDTMTISKTVRLMEKKGLIEREEDVRDSRAKVLRNTKKGMEILKETSIAVEQIDENFFAFSDDNMKEFINLITLLRNVNME